MYGSLDELEQQAKKFYDAENYEEAGKLFHQLWDTRQDAFSGGRYAHCLRKAGFPDAGLKVALIVLEQFPEDIHVKREVVWALYDSEFKRAKEAQHLMNLQRIGQHILDLTSELLPRKLVVFAVIDVAKEKMKWDIVRQWCDYIDHQALDSSPREMGGRRVISELEQWYFAKIKSLVETELWEEAFVVADEALQKYPRNLDYRRWYAQSLAGQGDLRAAITELEKLADSERASWFLLRDLAEMYFTAGDTTNAYQIACRAALAHGEDKAKIYLYLLIAKIALTFEDYQTAAHHLALTRSIQIREGWRASAEVIAVQEEIQSANSQIPIPENDSVRDIDYLKATCKNIWLKIAPPDKHVHIERSKPRQRSKMPADDRSYIGVVKKYITEKGFGFIQSSEQDEDIFFHISNWKSDLNPELGMKVVFRVGQGKKGMEAIQIELESNE